MKTGVYNYLLYSQIQDLDIAISVGLSRGFIINNLK